MRKKLLLILIAALLLPGCTTSARKEKVTVRIVAINDFHGNLQPPPDGLQVFERSSLGRSVNIKAGGAERMAVAVDNLIQSHPDHIFVAAGDLIGASPLLSSLFHDDPAIEALSMMGLEASAVGNHEFDGGTQELLRKQNGGCHPVDGCRGPAPFRGAQFKYLAANTVNISTGKTFFPPYFIKRFQGIPVAFIGITLEGAPGIIVPSSIAGLEFRNEADTVNRLVPQLRAQGIEAIVVLIHEGGLPTGGYNSCPGISGPIVDIVKRFDKAVDLVISGHTHKAYNCRIDGRLVTSADKYGTMLTTIDVVLGRSSGDVQSAVANNVIIGPDLPKDARQSRIIEQYGQLARPLAERVVGHIKTILSTTANQAGESPLGKVIADAHLAATKDAGAQVAFMNPGGIRAALGKVEGGDLVYEDLFTVQPFHSSLVTLTLTGTEIFAILEQQWLNQEQEGTLLQVSRGFTYSWDSTRPIGSRVVPGSILLAGRAIEAGASYRVTANAFLAGGGDKFPAFKLGRDRVIGISDVDALERHVKASPDLLGRERDRVVRLH